MCVSLQMKHMEREREITKGKTILRTVSVFKLEDLWEDRIIVGSQFYPLYISL